jgi:ubiquitin C-terminal hydrolase
MMYDLVGVSKHIGSLGFGHYIAHGRSSIDGEWYNFDDNEVRRVTAQEVVTDKVGAYVLFYLRRDYRPESFGPPAI